MARVSSQVKALLDWLQVNQPKVFRGLVERFTPPDAQMAGITDFLSNTVNTVSNFVSSQGFDKILQAAQPFIDNRLQQEVLKYQVQRLQSGLPLGSPTQIAAATQTSGVAPGSSAATPHVMPAEPFWKRITPLGWVAILGGGGLVAAWMLGSRTGRRA